MRNNLEFKVSIVVPVYDEAAGLYAFNTSLVEVAQNYDYEIIYCDDGSRDDTSNIVQEIHHSNPKVKLVKLSRNFGKESALAAGLAQATGDAIITLDGDGQHPVELIPDFISAWQDGAQVVVGVRNSSGSESATKRLQSRLFYSIFNKLSDQKMIPGSTDYRLIDKAVQEEFTSLQEVDRVTRGLIDWLGFKRELIYFTPKARIEGNPTYSQRKLIVLALNSFVSLTKTPLYFFGYLGIFITLSSFTLGSVVFIEQLLLGDPLSWNFTGTSMLGILIVFLIGIVLLSQGILSLYVSMLHNQSKQRPLFVVDYKHSAGIKKKS